MVLAAYCVVGLLGPASSPFCVQSEHCEGLFFRGVGELLQVGNGEVYSLEILERWWRASLLTEPAFEQSFTGTPASLPLHFLYGLGDPARQSVFLGVVGALILWLLSTRSAGMLFGLSILVGGSVAAGVVFGTPSLLLGVGALLVYRGLVSGGVWWMGIGLTVLAFRLEFALFGLVLLVLHRRIGALLVAFALSGLLWIVASLVWGGGISEGWAQALQHPPARVDTGLGLLGVVPGSDGAWIPYWWLAYGLLGVFAIRRSTGMSVARGFSFVLAVALLASPQITLADYVLLVPFFLAFFPRPERPGLVFGMSCYALSLVGLASLLPLVALILMYFGQKNLEQEVG